MSPAVSIALILVALLALIYYLYSATTQHLVPTPSSPPDQGTKGPQTGGGLHCGSQAMMNEAKKYYEQVGPYHGLFVIDPVSSVQVDGSNCDLKYQYASTPNNPRQETGVDWRRFTYQFDPNYGYRVVLMGEWKSGVLNA
jgi:hypothetical protein